MLLKCNNINIENSNSSDDEFLTIKEVSKLLKLNQMSVYRLLSQKKEQGKIFAKKIIRSWGVKRKEIDRYFSNTNNNKT
ncbi:MAG: helix-turn-helix domain-containing protein [Candidatus Humimicrobiaceae bacterium]